MNEQLPAAIALLAGAYPAQAFPEDSARIFARLLADVPERPLLEAVEYLARVQPFRPSVAEIRLRVARKQLALPTAAQAYDKIFVSEPLPNFAAEIVKSMGGRWGFRIADNSSILRAQFVREYDQAAARLVEEAAASHGCQALPSPATHHIKPGDRLIADVPAGTTMWPVEQEDLGPTMQALPVSSEIAPRPLVRWARHRGIPNDAEKHDAIQALRDLPPNDDLAVVALEMLDRAGR